MYAYIQIGSHQHKVEKDAVFHCNQTENNPNDTFFNTQVLLFAESDKKVHTGKPFLTNVKVELQVLENLRGTKIAGLKYKKRKGYRKRWGHRQEIQKMKVVAIHKDS